MGNPVLFTLLLGAAAFVVAVVLTPLIRSFALSQAVVDPVRDDRWSRSPTPRLGGLAIFGGFAVAAGIGIALRRGAVALEGDGIPPWGGWSAEEAIVLAGFVMFVTGLADDRRALAPAAKLLPQLVAAVVLIASGVMLRLTGVFALDVTLSIFWFVGITNALNLLDNMDGLAGGIAVIGAIFLGAIFLADGRVELALFALALAGATGGFLVHNFPPSKIFMGDSGALFLGVVLAGLALSPVPGGSRGVLAVLAVPAALLAIPILDTTLVTAARVLEGRSVAQGGRDHTSHRLVALGVPERHAVLFLWSLAALGGAVAFFLQGEGRTVALLVGGGFLVVLVLVGARLLQVTLPHHLIGRSDAEAQFRRALLWGRVRPVFLIVLDVLVVVLAYYAAYLIRWRPPELVAELEYFQRSLPLVVGAKLLGFGLAGLYDRTGILDDPRLLFRASTVGSLAAAAVLLLVAGFGLSRGVLLLDFFFCTLLAGAVRLAPGFRMAEV